MAFVYGRPRAIRQDLILRERREENDAPAFDAEPSSPMGRRDVPDVGNARVAVAALEGKDIARFDFNRTAWRTIFARRP
jgi:hypothetical protein